MRLPAKIHTPAVVKSRIPFGTLGTYWSYFTSLNSICVMVS